MRHRFYVATILATALFASFGMQAATSASPTNSDAKKRLAYCGSIPNGSSRTVVDTTRLFIFLPKDLYPHIKLSMSSHESFATSVANAGAYGYAQSRNAKPGCWSYAFDFHVVINGPYGRATGGIVDIGSKSAFKTVSNYLIHFKVVANPPSAIKELAGNGTLVGQVVLGPVCPVEHIPPDPACAPRPYKTSINVWSATTGSSYQRVNTDASGSFKLSLNPGDYSLAVTPPANGSPLPRCAQVNFSVVAKKTQNLTVSCDTGIR